MNIELLHYSAEVFLIPLVSLLGLILIASGLWAVPKKGFGSARFIYGVGFGAVILGGVFWFLQIWFEPVAPGPLIRLLDASRGLPIEATIQQEIMDDPDSITRFKANQWRLEIQEQRGGTSKDATQ